MHCHILCDSRWERGRRSMGLACRRVVDDTDEVRCGEEGAGKTFTPSRRFAGV